MRLLYGKWIRILTIIMSLVLLAFAGIFVYVYTLLSTINETQLIVYEDDENNEQTSDYENIGLDRPIRTMHPTKEDLEISDEAPEEKETGIANILLLGLDRRSKNEPARSDSIIIATVDKKKKNVKLISLMRDMYMPIPGKMDNRINAAYAFGGPALAIKAINQNFNMNIEHYISVDFWGFEELIDILGGVEIDVSSAEKSVIGVASTGRQLLDGGQTLIYARIRNIGNSDFERTERQCTVLNQIYHRVTHISVFKIPELLPVVLPYVETNLNRGELLHLAKDILSFGRGDIHAYRIPIDGSYANRTIRGMAVLVPDMDVNKESLHAFIYEE